MLKSKNDKEGSSLHHLWRQVYSHLREHLNSKRRAFLDVRHPLPLTADVVLGQPECVYDSCFGTTEKDKDQVLLPPTPQPGQRTG